MSLRVLLNILERTYFKNPLSIIRMGKVVIIQDVRQQAGLALFTEKNPAIIKAAYYLHSTVSQIVNGIIHFHGNNGALHVETGLHRNIHLNTLMHPAPSYGIKPSDSQQERIKKVLKKTAGNSHVANPTDPITGTFSHLRAQGAMIDLDVMILEEISTQGPTRGIIRVPIGKTVQINTDSDNNSSLVASPKIIFQDWPDLFFHQHML
jgi:hypothetical protein